MIVEGVLSGDAGGAGDGKHWSLVFHLMPWRVVGRADFPALPLRIEIPVSEKRLEQWMDRVEDRATVQLAVARLESANPSWSSARGRLPIRRVKGSAELQAARAARQEPVVIRDRALGMLVLEREYGWFATRLRFRGRRTGLSISQSGATEDRARDLRDVARAKTILARVEAGWRAIEAAIVKDKLDLYNHTWRERGRVLSAAGLLQRVRLESIVIHGDGRASLYFHDGGLFLGHAIEVRLGARGAVREVCLAG